MFILIELNSKAPRDHCSESKKNLNVTNFELSQNQMHIPGGIPTECF